MYIHVQATLRFLKKKGVVQKNHVVRHPQPLEEGGRVSAPLYIHVHVHVHMYVHVHVSLLYTCIVHVIVVSWFLQCMEFVPCEGCMYMAEPEELHTARWRYYPMHCKNHDTADLYR